MDDLGGGHASQNSIGGGADRAAFAARQQTIPESFGGLINSEGAGQIRSVGKGGPEVDAPVWSRPERSEW